MHPSTAWILGITGGIGLLVWLRPFESAAAWVTLACATGAVLLLRLQSRSRGTDTSLLTALGVASATGLWAWIAFLDARWYWKAGLLAVVVGPTMSLANASYRHDIRSAQAEREAAAAAVTEAVVAGERPDQRFALYLRPFASTERLGAQAMPSELSNDVPVHLDLEGVLRRALDGDRVLVALGRPGEVAEGAARVLTTDDEWRAVARLLLARSSGVFMLPLDRPSTMWELRHIVDEGLLGTTVFVMPETVGPTPSGVIHYTENTDRIFTDVGVQRYSHQERSLDLVDEWNRAARAAEGMGVHLPPYAPCGALFTIDPDSLEPLDIVPLPLSTVGRRARAMRGMIASAETRQPIRLRDPRGVSAVVELGFFRKRGRTVEYNLVRAADGYVVWGEPRLAAGLLTCAAAAGGPRSPVVRGYLGALPDWATPAADADQDVTGRYAAAAGAVLDEPMLSGLLPGEVAERLRLVTGRAAPPVGPADVVDEDGTT